MSEDSGEGSSLSLVMNKLQSSGAFGKNEGEARAKVIESRFSFDDLVKSAHTAAIALALPALLLMGRVEVDHATIATLDTHPNPVVSARLESLRELEDETALPLILSTRFPALKAATGVVDLLAHIELNRQAAAGVNTNE